MNKSSIVGMKYAAAGVVIYAIARLVLAKLMGITVSVGVGFGIMAAMVILASSAAYRAGWKDRGAGKVE